MVEAMIRGDNNDEVEDEVTQQESVENGQQ